MKMIKILAGAILAGGIVSTSALASVETASVWPQTAQAGKPTVTKVVNPTRLPQSAEGATVKVAFTVDANGQPRDIRLLSPADPYLTQSLVTALSQWRFNPVQKDGVPVSTRVVMPLKLISNS